MKKNLLIITVAGALKWLPEAFGTFKETVNKDRFDVLVVDDSTPGDEARSYCQERGILFLSKPKPKGLTNSWNIGYQYFMSKGYEACILSNDDVRYSSRFSVGLLDGLKKFDLVGPLTNHPGVFRHQRMRLGVKVNSSTVEDVQVALIEEFSSSPYVECQAVSGFCFAFSRGVERFKFADELLFHPRFINTGNEIELCERVKKGRGRIAYCKVSYVFHWKEGLCQKFDRGALWR